MQVTYSVVEVHKKFTKNQKTEYAENALQINNKIYHKIIQNILS